MGCNLMGMIYEQSIRGLISLGEYSKKGTPVDFALIQELVTYYAENSEKYGHFELIPIPTKSLSFMNPPRWKNLRTLHIRDWFERVCVLQEVGLARSAEPFC